MEITEKELHRIINEQIEKYLLKEFADQRHKYIERIDNLMPQFVENWCLIHYCTLYNIDINRCKKHWKEELSALFLRLASFNLKKNNSFDNRTKTIKYAVEQQELLDNEQSIDFNITIKFKRENIYTNNNALYIQCIKDLIQQKNVIIELIANANKKQIIDYIEQI